MSKSKLELIKEEASKAIQEQRAKRQKAN